MASNLTAERPQIGQAVPLLACPDCKRPVSGTPEAVVCSSCGRRYPVFAGIIDFRGEGDRTAGFSLDRDREVAKMLERSFAGRSYFELYDHYRATMDRAEGASLTGPRQAARQRYRRTLEEQHLRQGDAILRRVAAHLGELGREDALRTGVALEDGAGLGQFVDGFSRRFRTLIVVDLSLCYLLLAKKVVEERGLRNVVLACGNVERLPVREDVVDFAHFNNMIEHVADPAAAFREGRRVLRPGGLFFVVSPNRYSLYFEPHFRLPAFGFIPRPLRQALLRRFYDRDDMDDVRLHSLRELKGLLRVAFGASFAVRFVPRALGPTVVKTPTRRLVQVMLASPGLGRLADTFLNRILLGIMPYHVALCFKQGDGADGATPLARDA